MFVVTVKPGYTLQEVANEVDDLPGRTGQAFLAEARSGSVPSPFQPPGNTNLEGLLGTGSYQVVPGETYRQLLTVMVERLRP